MYENEIFGAEISETIEPINDCEFIEDYPEMPTKAEHEAKMKYFLTN